LFTEARPSASIRNSKSEYLRRNSSASAFDSARLLVKLLSDSCSIDNCLRSCSFWASNVSAVTACSAFSILDSDKELSPSAASPRASITQPIINKVENWRLRAEGFFPRLFLSILNSQPSTIWLPSPCPNRVFCTHASVKIHQAYD